MYILTSVWVMRTPNAGVNMFFPIFSKKTWKRKKKRNKKEQKAGPGFCLYIKEPLNQRLGANPPKTPLFASFCLVSFCLLFVPFCILHAKKVKKVYLGQLLECTAHKHQSKYTTPIRVKYVNLLVHKWNCWDSESNILLLLT